MSQKVLDEFEALFKGKLFKHRVSNQGDHVAGFLIDDLLALGKSPKLQSRATSKDRVLNTENRAVGKAARRGDGTFGERVPTEAPVELPGRATFAGKVATIEIGVEVKILNKAMIRQVERVGTDLENQVKEFRSHNPDCITVAIVGVNWADHFTSWEGDKAWPTTGKGKYKHPFQEAGEAEARLKARIAPKYDELLILPFKATNTEPFDFAWKNAAATAREYSASLVRIARLYESRF